MSKRYLLVVESPTKSLTISKYFTEKFDDAYIDTVATKGHFNALPSKSGSIVFDKKYIFKWEQDLKKVENLTKDINKYDKIFILTDCDREGEAIGFFAEELFKDKKFNKEIVRGRFTELSKESIINCLRNPTVLDKNLVYAYLCRVGLDYTIGYELSPVLRNFFFKKIDGLSAGRVQSPALLLIIKRESEIINFKSREYFTINGDFGFPTELTEYKNEKTKEYNIDVYEDLLKYKNTIFQVKKNKPKELSVKPKPPFITSTLQEEISSKFGYSIDEIMKIAQNLYEGMEIEPGKHIPLITYMRTDSSRVDIKFLEKNKSFFEKNFNEYFDKFNEYADKKVKNAQEAHECIRPIDLNIDPKILNSEKHYNVYKSIWQRFVASQLLPSKNQIISYKISNNDAVFSTSSSIQIFDGFKIIYEGKQKKTQHLEIPEKTTLLNLDLIKHQTTPPDRYTEASFVEELVKNGLGRPATYATIIKILLERNYVYKENRSLVPTIKGTFVIGMLSIFFEKYLEPNLTSQMEENLDKIANGKLNWEKVLRNYELELKDFIDKFKKTYEKGFVSVFFPVKDKIKNFLSQCKVCEKPIDIFLGKSNLIKCQCDGFKKINDSFLMVGRKTVKINNEKQP